MVFNKLFSLFPYNNSHTSLSLNKNSVIFLGPWMGEVGPELLYWIPYLRFLKSKDFFINRRLIAVSRGGANIWYEGITSEYIEIFQHTSIKQFLNIRDESIKTGKKKKQVKYTTKEKELIEQIANTHNIKEYKVFHPSLMWENMLGWVRGQMTLDQASNKLLFKPIRESNNHFQKIVDTLHLPKRYITAKFYTNPLLPKNEKNYQIIQSLIKVIARDIPVVNLGMKDTIDDHREFDVTEAKHLISIGKQFTLANNLGIQTEIIRRSEFFIGTNGGFSILPMLLDRHVLCFYSEPLEERIQNYCQHETMRMKCKESIGKSSYTVLHSDTWKILTHFMKY